LTDHNLPAFLEIRGDYFLRSSELIIRKTQIEALDEVRLPDFEHEMVAHLRDFTPLHSKTLGEPGIRSLIRAGMERARKHGFKRRGPVQFYIETTVLFGIDFDTDPQYPWLRPLLDDPALPDELERADKVHAVVTGYLAEVAGEHRELARSSLARVRGIPFEPPSGSSPGFNDQMIARAREIYPEKADAVGHASLEQLIERAVDDARTWHAATDAGICLFFGIMFSVGHGFINDPKYPWIANTLGQPGYTREKRVERLYSKTMTYLEHVLVHLERT
jgi:hypothetical protein